MYMYMYTVYGVCNSYTMANEGLWI